MAAKLQNFPDISRYLTIKDDLKRILCASTGRRLSIWMLLTALRVIATISARIRSMPLAITVSAWKESSSRQSSNDQSPCKCVLQMVSRIR